jgi:sporulation protein YlmC with PRC-barrel domain
MLEDSTAKPSAIAGAETTRLIGSSKVEGTLVYNSRGDSIGSIYELMIDKRSGKVAHAVMSFGGFLGIGQHYHPLPWDSLEYDRHHGGYVINAEAEQLLSLNRDGLYPAAERVQH